MIDDLLSRIDVYRERVHASWYRRQDEEPEYDGEDVDEYEDDESEEDAYVWASPEIPDVIEIDETVEEISGHCNYSQEHAKPLRYSVSPDNPWYFDIDGVVFSRETGLLICFPPGYGGEYTVPDDERITGIGERAFAGNHLLKEISLNSRIRYIGDYAFRNCQGLQEIDLPASVEYVGRGAFECCESLKKAVLNFTVKSIPHSCFRSDSSLQTVRYPADITEIERAVFEGCTSLQDVKPAGQEDADCDLVISSSVSTVGRYAFRYCRQIRSVCLPDRTVDLGNGAFEGCSALERINTENVRSYGSICFRYCTGLTDFTFGSGTAHLGWNMFWRADNLKHIDITCSPDLDCDAFALPEDMDYTVDTRAWLSIKNPWACRVLFKQCVMNIISGESVPEETVLSAVKALKRNRRKCFDWFLSDDALLDWVFDKRILDGEDCLALLDIMQNDNPQKAEMIRSHMQQRFSGRQIATAQKRRKEKERKKIEAELEKQRIREEQERRKQRARELHEPRMAEIRSDTAGVSDITLEEMDLSVRAYNCLKRHGINTLYEVTAMTDEELMRVRNIGQKAIQEVKDKVDYFLSGGTVPKKTAVFPVKNPEDFSVDDLAGLLDDL